MSLYFSVSDACPLASDHHTRARGVGGGGARGGLVGARRGLESRALAIEHLELQTIDRARLFEMNERKKRKEWGLKW